jgi:hypothetical protein
MPGQRLNLRLVAPTCGKVKHYSKAEAESCSVSWTSRPCRRWNDGRVGPLFWGTLIKQVTRLCDMCVACLIEQGSILKVEAGDLTRQLPECLDRGGSSNGPGNWFKAVISRVFPGLRGWNQAVSPRIPPELDVEADFYDQPTSGQWEPGLELMGISPWVFFAHARRRA